mgnify:CR=1 FL=1
MYVYFIYKKLKKYINVLVLQSHGFFNCSPAVDVPPSPRACESDVKEGHVKETIATKSVSNGLIAML